MVRAPLARSASARSRAIASPVRRPVAAISPMNVSNVAARSGQASPRAAAISARICAGVYKYGAARDTRRGSRPRGMVWDAGSIVAR